MDKYVIFSYDEGYTQAQFRDIRDDIDVSMFEGMKSVFLSRLHRLHNCWPLNKHFELPFKFVWYNWYLKKGFIEKNDMVYFIFLESTHISFSEKYLCYLKKKYPNSKFCFLFVNPANAYNIEKFNKVSVFYDKVFSFIPDDVNKYGWLYYTGCYCPIELPDSNLPHSDIFFIGSDKGRLEKILDVYSWMTARGFKCDFYITDVDKSKIIHGNGIVYNRRITYEEVLQHIQKTDCILEVLLDGCNYSSIRTFEAMVYKKKLLTTNCKINHESFYNPSIMRCFNRASDIDEEFIKKLSVELRIPGLFLLMKSIRL